VNNYLFKLERQKSAKLILHAWHLPWESTSCLLRSARTT